MEVLNLAAAPLEERKNRFWRRQFAPGITTPQIVFDFCFGAVGPVLCFIFDPIVFRGGFLGAPLLPDYQIFTYLFSGLQIVLLFMWLTLGPKNTIGRHIIGAAFVTGAFFCTVVGLVLIPFSILGLMFGIGLFGFTPLISGFVYLRNSVRVFRSARPATNITKAGALLAGAALAIATPLLVSIEIHAIVSNAVSEVIHGDPQRAHLAAHRLIPFQYFAGAELNKIVNAYLDEQDPERRALLKACYQEIAGEDIELRARMLRD
jgi:hypothetical protein